MGSTGRVFPRSSPAWGPPTSARFGKVQLEFEGECRYRSRMMALQGARLGIGSAPYKDGEFQVFHRLGLPTEEWSMETWD